MSKQDNEILHAYLEEQLNKELIANYGHFTILQKCSFEEGLFMLIKNAENIEKIIGVVPVNSNSIYTVNETFRVDDFTDEKLIIKKPIIVCDEQGGILCLHKERNKSGFISNIIKKENFTKSFIFDNYDIDYQSFYYVAKSNEGKNAYADLTDKNKVIEFIINLH